MKKRQYRKAIVKLFAIGLFLVFFLVLYTPTNAIEVPQYLSYQARLTDSSDSALSGTYSVEFKIYDALTGGSALWTETQNVTVSNGYFSARLGSSTALNLAFDKQYYLGVNVASDGEMSPRQAIDSSAYAYSADVAYGTYVSSTAPTTGDGRLYFDSSDSNLYVYDGSSWVDLTVQGGGGDAVLSANQTFSGKNTFTASTTLATTTADVLTATSLFINDTAADNTLGLVFNEDAAADRLLNITIGAGDRTLALSGNLTVESASLLNQDLTTDASPTFAGLTLNAFGDGLVAVSAGAFTTTTSGLSPTFGGLTVSGDSYLNSTFIKEFTSTTQWIGPVSSYLTIGTASTTQSLGTGAGGREGDLLVSGRMEVDERLYVEGLAMLTGGFQASGNSKMNGNILLLDSGSSMGLYNNTSVGVSSFYAGLQSTTKVFLIDDYANRLKDHGLASHDDPTLYLFSSIDTDTDDTQWGSLSFNSSTDRFVIGSGSGTIDLNSDLYLNSTFLKEFTSTTQWIGPTANYLTIGTASTTHDLGAGAGGTNDGDLLVSGELEVDGTTYLDGTLSGGIMNGSIITASTQLKLSSSSYLVQSLRADDGVYLAVGGNTANRANYNLIITGELNSGKDHDHSGQSGDPTLFIHSNTDPDTDNTEWLSFHYNSSTDKALFETGKGALQLLPATGSSTWVGDAGTPTYASANDDLFVSGALEVDGTSYFGSTVYAGLLYANPLSIYSVDYLTFRSYSDGGTNMAVGSGDGGGNNALVLTTYSNSSKDHDHDTPQDDPTLFIHSGTDPDTDNTEWLSFSFNSSTDQGEIKTGKGHLSLSPGNGMVSIGAAVGAYPLHVSTSTDGDVAGFTDSNGTCTINPTATALQCSSDMRLKRDVQRIDGALDMVMALQGVSFLWNNQSTDDRRIGFIAQEVEEIVPEVVNTDARGYKSVGYSAFVPILTQAIKEQQLQIDTLRDNGGVKIVDSAGTTLQGSVNGNILADELQVKGHAIFNSDTVGRARILKGDANVKIEFENAYEFQPIVTISAMDYLDGGQARVVEVTNKSFQIDLSKQLDRDIMFNWHALAVDGGKIHVSDGTLEDIELVVEEVIEQAEIVVPTSQEVDDSGVDPEPVSTETIVESETEVVSEESGEEVPESDTAAEPVTEEVNPDEEVVVDENTEVSVDTTVETSPDPIERSVEEGLVTDPVADTEDLVVGEPLQVESEL